MASDFTLELERAKKQGVVFPANLPFIFEPAQKNGKAVLLIHGFGASPYEMRSLGKTLCDRGFLCLGVRLRGHGTSPEDLLGCTWQDWLESAEDALSILQGTGLSISLIGQSTGALVGLILAQHKAITRMALLSPFLKLRHPLAGFAGLLKYLIPFQKRQLPHPQGQHYYERRPLAGIEQIGLLINKIKPLLSEINVPTLILAAQGDQTVANGTGRRLFEKLGSTQKEFHLFGVEVPHVLSTAENPQYKETCRRIEAFLAKS